MLDLNLNFLIKTLMYKFTQKLKSTVLMITRCFPVLKKMRGTITGRVPVLRRVEQYTRRLRFRLLSTVILNYIYLKIM